MNWRRKLGLFIVDAGVTTGVFFSVRQIALSILRSSIDLTGTTVGAMLEDDVEMEMNVTSIKFGHSISEIMADAGAGMFALSFGLVLGKVLWDLCKQTPAFRRNDELADPLLDKAVDIDLGSMPSSSKLKANN